MANPNENIASDEKMSIKESMAFSCRAIAEEPGLQWHPEIFLILADFFDDNPEYRKRSEAVSRHRKWPAYWITAANARRTRAGLLLGAAEDAACGCCCSPSGVTTAGVGSCCRQHHSWQEFSLGKIVKRQFGSLWVTLATHFFLLSAKV